MKTRPIKTTPRICNRKKRFGSREAAEEAASRAPFKLRAYRCELCREFHLTSRTKGMKVPQYELDQLRSPTAPSIKSHN